MRRGIFILDPHPLFCRGLAATLANEPSHELLGSAGSIPQANPSIVERRPHLLITEIRLRDGRGLDLLRAMGARLPELRMLVCSACDEDFYAERALRAGACGYAMKEESESVFLRRATGFGRGSGHDPALGGAADASGDGGIRYAGLGRAMVGVSQPSSREMEVFEMLGRGRTAKEIGDALGISPRTADTHRIRMREKLGLQSSQELMGPAFSWQETRDLGGARLGYARHRQ